MPVSHLMIASMQAKEAMPTTMSSMPANGRSEGGLPEIKSPCSLLSAADGRSPGHFDHDVTDVALVHERLLRLREFLQRECAGQERPKEALLDQADDPLHRARRHDGGPGQLEVTVDEPAQVELDHGPRDGAGGGVPSAMAQRVDESHEHGAAHDVEGNIRFAPGGRPDGAFDIPFPAVNDRIGALPA